MPRLSAAGIPSLQGGEDVKNDWSTHLQALVKAERLATDALNHKRFDDAWQHIASMRQSVESAEQWLRKHHGKRKTDL